MEILLKNTSKNAQIWKFPLPNPLLPLASYYPFGMVIEGRSASSGDQYRYGFNGQEEEKDISGNESHTSAEFWMYDSRVGRRWNLDPVVKTSESSYLSFSNNPIWLIDPNGADTIRVSYESVKGDNNLRSVSFKRTGAASENLVVYYPEDDPNGPGRTDFKSGSYEYSLMHQSKKLKFGGNDVEVEAHKYLGNPLYTDENKSYYGFPTFYELEIEFKAPDHTSFDDAGVVNFNSAKESLDFIAEKFIANSTIEATIISASGKKLNVASNNIHILIIGYHSPETNKSINSSEGQKKANNDLALNRANGLKEYLIEGNIDKAKVHTANGGESNTRKATIIIHAVQPIILYNSN